MAAETAPCSAGPVVVPPATAGTAAAKVATATAAAAICAQCRLLMLTPFWRVMGWWRRR